MEVLGLAFAAAAFVIAGATWIRTQTDKADMAEELRALHRRLYRLESLPLIASSIAKEAGNWPINTQSES